MECKGACCCCGCWFSAFIHSCCAHSFSPVLCAIHSFNREKSINSRHYIVLEHIFMCFATNHRCHNCTHVCRFVFSFSCAVVVYVESIVLFSLTYYLLVCSAFVCTMLTTDLCFRNEIRLNSKYKLQTIQFSFAH